MIASSSSVSSSLVSAAPSCRAIWPWVRNTGGSPTRRCRSDDSLPTSCFRRATRRASAARYWSPANSPGNARGGGGSGGATGLSIRGAAAIADGRGGGGGGGGALGGAEPAWERRRSTPPGGPGGGVDRAGRVVGEITAVSRPV